MGAGTDSRDMELDVLLAWCHNQTAQGAHPAAEGVGRDMGNQEAGAAERLRYGIAEWYGRSFVNLTGDDRRSLAALQGRPREERPPNPCLSRGGSVPCTKAGGVCSIRLYQLSSGPQGARVAPAHLGELVTMCPYRFEESDVMFKWVGEEMLDDANPLVVSQVKFLERYGAGAGGAQGGPGGAGVGRIDNVLVRPTRGPMAWCALEIQAVHFSGSGMAGEFRAIGDFQGEGLPFPVGIRRPDYRSSGPKRLLPQLEIKVPTLRRWGKRMAVVVDEGFFSALGEMERVAHISNSDIAWFVMRYDEAKREAKLKPGFVHFTTLEHAVVGLTAGRPVTLEIFEDRIREKLRTVGR